MKRTLLLIVTVLFFLLSCKKEKLTSSGESAFLQNIKTSLKDSTTPNDFLNLDFTNSIITRLNNPEYNLLRIPFADKSISNDFVLLKVNANGQIFRGVIVGLKGSREISGRRVYFNGDISISSLDRSSIINSPIVEGVITKLHEANSTSRSFAQSALPEAVVTCYISSSGISYSDWLNLVSFFDNSAGAGGCYSNMAGPGGYSEGGGGTSYSNGYNTGGGKGSTAPVDDNVDYIDFEPLSDDAIDVKSYLKCFSNIPDENSSCSIEILTDIPVDTDPNKFFDWSNGSPGHTFLNLKKSNGNQTVSQYLGFYPKYGWKTLVSSSPVEGKFDDNGKHEFNASLKRDLKPSELQGVINKIETLAPGLHYDIDDYNCTDFALDVFNSVPNTYPIIIQKFEVPVSGPGHKTSTPQGVYLKLKSMKDANMEGPNINIPSSKAYAGASHGSCN